MEDAEARGREVGEGERLAFALVPVLPVLGDSDFKNSMGLWL